LVGGVAPSLQAPLAWLHAHLHAPDYFLYVVVRADLAR
jgi:autophagy-related protein 5